jgi:hypothetical protein
MGKQGNARWHGILLFYCYLLNLIINSSFFIFTSLRVLSASSASAVTRWHPPLTPPLTAVALHPPLPLPNARARLGLSWKLECPNCLLLQLPLRCFLRPCIGGDKATIASSLIVVFHHLIVALHLAPPPPALLCWNGRCPCSRTLLNG